MDDALQQAVNLNPPLPKRPADAFTTAEYAEKIGMSMTSARRKLKLLVETGHLKSVSFLHGRNVFTGYLLTNAEDRK